MAKKQFKCRNCGKVNEFDTEAAISLVRIREAADPLPDDEKGKMKVYFVNCKYCGTENTLPYWEK